MGGGSKQSSDQSSRPGTLSPVTASILSIFGGQPEVRGGQFVPTSFGQGGVFSPQSFSALGGMLQNQPLSSVEQAILGARPGANGEMVFGGGIQGLGLEAALQSQELLQEGAQALRGQLAGPEAAIAQARRGFQQETLPAILERAPGFSSSDLQRELTRGGVDLETNIAALREASRTGALAQVPGFAQALGANLLDQTANVLGFGQLGRDFLRETGPAGDAFRVLTAIQGLVGQGYSNVQVGSSKGKSTQVL